MSTTYPGIQMFIGPEEPRPERIDPIENADGANGIAAKPLGGLWTSTLREDGSSGWLAWCRMNGFGIDDDTKAWLLDPDPGVSVLIIDSHADFRAVLDEYPRTDELASILGGAIDFERIAAETEYDGVRLTRQGQRETRLTLPNLYGWDSEWIIWHEWAFSEVDYLCGIGDVE